MAFMKTSISFSLALLATTFVLSTSIAQSSTVSPFCDNATDKALCTHLAKGAKTWAEAMTNSLKAVMEKAKAGESIVLSIRSKLPGELDPDTKESIDSTCREAYENMLINITECMGFVENDPYSSLTTYLSMTSMSDCEDGLEDFDVSSPEVAEFANEMQKLSSTLLAVAQKKP